MQMPRELLYERINERVLTMIENGLELEVRNLIPHLHLNALQTVGYSEWLPYFEGKINIQKVKEQIQQNTRHYAKRQMTWFKKDPDINWYEADQMNASQIMDGPTV